MELLFDPDAIAGKQDPQIPGEADKPAELFMYWSDDATRSAAGYISNRHHHQRNEIDGHQVFVVKQQGD